MRKAFIKRNKAQNTWEIAFGNDYSLVDIIVVDEVEVDEEAGHELYTKMLERLAKAIRRSLEVIRNEKAGAL